MDDHKCSLECGEQRCMWDADVAFCEKHFDKKIEDAKSEAKDDATSSVEEVMRKWEGIVDIDNPVSIVDLKKEIVAAIES